MSVLDFPGLSYFYNKIKVAFIPVTGGTLTGVITASTPTGAAPYVIDTSDPENAPDDPADRAWISANRKNGAFFETEEDGTIYSRLVLRYPSHSTQSGWFRLRAYNTTGSSELIGTPEGSLTWKGNELAIDNDVVHLSGTEAIVGTKNFQAAPSLQRTTITKGTAPSAATWWTLGCADKEGVATKNRLGAFEVGLDASNNVTTYLRAYKPEHNSTAFAAVTVVYPASGNPYASAPSTPTGSTGTEIVTADYLNSTNSGVVHTTGDETVEGLKTFTEGIAIDRTDTTPAAGEMVGAFTLKYKNASGTVVNCYPIQYISGTGTANNTLAFGSSNGGTIIGAGEGGKRIYATNNTAANSESLFLAADGGIWGYAGCANDGSGGTNIFMGNSAGMNFYVPTTAPTPASTDDSTNVATTAFVKDWVKTTVPTGAKFTDTVTTATASGSGNVVTAVTASNGALTVTKGSTAVLTSGNQTVAGTKTFSWNGIRIQDSNLTKGSKYASRNYEFIILEDSANSVLGGIHYETTTDGGCFLSLEPRQLSASGNVIATLGIGFKADGTIYTETHTPDTTDNSDQIATTSFVQTHSNAKINISGSRGNLAGYQTPEDRAAAFTLNYNTRDIVNLTAAVKVTVTNSAGSSAAWVKYVFILNAGATVALGNKWHWKDSTTPTISANSVLVLMWCKTFGIADLIK